MNDKKVAVKTITPPAAQAMTPMDMISRALDQGLSDEQLGRFMDLNDRWQADEARKAFVHAMTSFKAEPLRVTRDKHVSYGSGSGKTSYSHVSLANLVDAAVAGMSKHGLSHRWETHQEGSLISVTCVITHENGHAERTTLSASPDTSGGKNPIQAVGSTVAYLERYTLMAALGLAASDMDNDATLAEEVSHITESQVLDLEALIEEAGADKAKLLKWLKVESLDQIVSPAYKDVVAKLRLKAKQGAK
jgi:hypothetical protein